MPKCILFGFVFWQAHSVHSQMENASRGAAGKLLFAPDHENSFEAGEATHTRLCFALGSTSCSGLCRGGGEQQRCAREKG